MIITHLMSLEEAIGYVAFDELIEHFSMRCDQFLSSSVSLFMWCANYEVDALLNLCRISFLHPYLIGFSFGLMKPASNGGKNSLVTKLAGTFIYLAPKYTNLHCTLYSSMNQVDEDIKSSSCGDGYGDDEGSRSNMARIANFN
ncbi:hypothetical protein FXO37_04864 [Capsicum annuum]|nr:hypothetical protein FXO37_04864 [Capsicum annuum]